MCVCVYVYVRPFADSPDQQTSNQHLSNLNNHLKKSTQASINASQEYLTVRPHPQGPSIFRLCVCVCVCVCVYVYVRPFADNPDQQTLNQHLSNLNNHLKQSTQASINASQEYLTVRPHPQGPSILNVPDIAYAPWGPKL